MTVLQFPGVGDDVLGRPGSYEEYLTGIGLSRNTIRAYLSRLDKATNICSELGSDLATADAFTLAQMASRMEASHAMRGQLRCALKHYYSWSDRMDAPLRAVRVPPQPQMVNKALDATDASKLVATARGWWPQGGAVLLGMYLALRRFEIAKAEWSRFDEDMQWYRVTGKYDKTATLPVHPVLRGELSGGGEGYVFKGRFGGHVSPATIWAWTKEVATAAGIERFTTHQLRHTSLTTALDNTENLRSVMEFARHSRPQTTAGYTRTTKEQLRTVSEALNF